MPVYDLRKRAISLRIERRQVKVEENPIGTGREQSVGQRRETRTVPGPGAGRRDGLVVDPDNDHLAADRLRADLVAQREEREVDGLHEGRNTHEARHEHKPQQRLALSRKRRDRLEDPGQRHGAMVTGRTLRKTTKRRAAASKKHAKPT